MQVLKGSYFEKCKTGRPTNPAAKNPHDMRASCEKTSNSIPNCLNLSKVLAIATHTAPEWCQPDKLATLSFSAFLVVCDQDKRPYVGQQILKGGNLHHNLSLKFIDSSQNHCCPI